MSDTDQDSPEEDTQEDTNAVDDAGHIGISVTPLTARAIVDQTSHLENKRDEIIEHYEDTRELLHNELRAFVVLLYATIEEYSSQLIEQELLNARHSEEGYKLVSEELTQNTRNKFLKTYELCDSKVVGWITNFAKVRNDIVHKPNPTINLDDNQTLAAINNGLKAAKHLRDKLLNSG